MLYSHVRALPLCISRFVLLPHSTIWPVPSLITEAW